MGFYHYLKVESVNGNQTDVGGYSKGGSLNHWYFAFSPMEHHNNLEEAAEQKSWDLIIKKGYKTTVENAQKRLSVYLERLKTLHPKPLRLEERKLANQLIDGINELWYKLNRFNKDDILHLDQSDGATYALKRDKEYNILGLESWWYQNEAGHNEKTIQELENSHITLHEMMEDVSASLINQEIENFFQDVVSFIGEAERSYGPNPASEIFEWGGKLQEINNPSLLYKESMKILLSKMHKENLEEYDELLDESDIVICSEIIVKYFHDTLEFMKNTPN